MMFSRILLVLVSTFVLLWLGGYTAFVISVITTKPENPDIKTEAIVVLTGGNHRIDTGLDLFARQRAPYLFITGVIDGVTVDKLINRWDGLPGGSRMLPACCIELEYNAHTTQQNAEESKAWIEARQINSIHLVTSPYHMPRALVEFSNLMPELVIYPHPVTKEVLGLKDEFFWHITFSEYHKMILRMFQIYTEDV